MSFKARQLGTCPPISEAAPTAQDMALDSELRRTLNCMGVFESALQRQVQPAFCRSFWVLTREAIRLG